MMFSIHGYDTNHKACSIGNGSYISTEKESRQARPPRGDAEPWRYGDDKCRSCKAPGRRHLQPRAAEETGTGERSVTLIWSSLAF